MNKNNFIFYCKYSEYSERGSIFQYEYKEDKNNLNLKERLDISDCPDYILKYFDNKIIFKMSNNILKLIGFK